MDPLSNSPHAPEGGTPGPSQTPPMSPAGGTPSGTPASPAPSAPQTSPSAAAPATQTPPSAGVLEQLRGMGVEGNFQSEQQALQYLAGVHRQSGEWRQLAGYGQQYLQHQTQFQEFLRQQEAQKAAQAQQQGASWWKAPEYDQGWLSKVYRDPQTGELRTLPGADPGIVQKLAAWTDHQRGFLDRFSQDPMKAIGPGVQEMVRAEAQALIQQHLGGYQERTAAQQIVQQHASWMFERGADGGALRDPNTGRPVMNEWGQRYAQYVQQAQQGGLHSVERQNEYALGLVQRDYLVARAQQAGNGAAQPNNNPANERFLAGAQHRPNAAAPAATPNGAPSPGQTQANGARGLAELLQRNLQAAGYGPGQTIVG